MANHRLGRLNEEIAKSISKIMMNVKDWRLNDIVISISGVSAAPDLSNAKVYYSYLGKRDRKEVKDGLKSATGFIRSRLAAELDLRHTPELIFIFDESFEHGAKISGLLKKVGEELRETDRREAQEAAAKEAAIDSGEDVRHNGSGEERVDTGKTEEGVE